MARMKSSPTFEIGDPDLGAQGHHGKGHQHRDHDRHRGEHEDEPVGEGRDPVLLEEDLDHVGDDLEQPERADPVGAVAVLPESQQTSLVPDQQRRQGQHDPEDDDDVDEGSEEGGSWQPRDLRPAPAGSAGRPGRPSGRPAQPTGQSGSELQREMERPARRSRPPACRPARRRVVDSRPD